MEIQTTPITSLVSDPYYQEEFQKIQDSSETYKGKWNWWAFFFTGLWAISKGCWVLFIIIVLTSSLLQYRLFNINDYAYVTIGFSSTIWALIMGWRGTWFYYVLKVKKKQPPL